jgi:hypothetical protein
VVKKIVIGALVAFAIYFLLSDPAGAAGLVRHLLGDLRSAGHSLSSFVSSL